MSGDDDSPADGDPDELDFSGTNGTYTAGFAPFFRSACSRPSGSNMTDTTFVLAGSTTRAQTNGIGVVFGDVDVAGSIKIELFAADGTSLGSFAAPAAGSGSERFSFVGVFFDAGERIALARITTGAAALRLPRAATT